MSLKGKLIGGILRFVGKKLDGKKTYIGAAGLILTGVVGLLAYIVPDMGLPEMEVETALGTISAGIAAMGLGHKVEKTKNATGE